MAHNNRSPPKAIHSAWADFVKKETAINLHPQDGGHHTATPRQVAAATPEVDERTAAMFAWALADLSHSRRHEIATADTMQRPNRGGLSSRNTANLQFPSTNGRAASQIVGPVNPPYNRHNLAAQNEITAVQGLPGSSQDARNHPGRKYQLRPEIPVSVSAPPSKKPGLTNTKAKSAADLLKKPKVSTVMKSKISNEPSKVGSQPPSGPRAMAQPPSEPKAMAKPPPEPKLMARKDATYWEAGAADSPYFLNLWKEKFAWDEPSSSTSAQPAILTTTTTVPVKPATIINVFQPEEAAPKGKENTRWAIPGNLSFAANGAGMLDFTPRFSFSTPASAAASVATPARKVATSRANLEVRSRDARSESPSGSMLVERRKSDRLVLPNTTEPLGYQTKQATQAKLITDLLCQDLAARHATKAATSIQRQAHTQQKRRSELIQKPVNHPPTIHPDVTTRRGQVNPSAVQEPVVGEDWPLTRQSSASERKTYSVNTLRCVSNASPDKSTNMTTDDESNTLMLSKWAPKILKSSQESQWAIEEQAAPSGEIPTVAVSEPIFEKKFSMATFDDVNPLMKSKWAPKNHKLLQNYHGAVKKQDSSGQSGSAVNGQHPLHESKWAPQPLTTGPPSTAPVPTKRVNFDDENLVFPVSIGPPDGTPKIACWLDATCPAMFASFSKLVDHYERERCFACKTTKSALWQAAALSPVGNAFVAPSVIGTMFRGLDMVGAHDAKVSPFTSYRPRGHKFCTLHELFEFLEFTEAQSIAPMMDKHVYTLLKSLRARVLSTK